MSNSLANVYYTGSFTNNTPNPVPAQIRETRTSPLLENPENWQMSVIRFDVSMSIVPINTPQMLGASKTVTASVISIKHLGVVYSANVVKSPTGNTAGLSPDLIIPAIYHIQNWLDDINQALISIYAAAPPFAAFSVPPKYIYNPVTMLIELYVDGSYVPTPQPPAADPAIPTPPVLTISLNFILWQYLSNFEYFFNGYNPADQCAFDLTLNNTNCVTQPAVGARVGLPLQLQARPVTMYLCKQTDISIGRWNSARSLILVSNLLPIRPDNIPTNTIDPANYSSDGTLQIVSDFLLPLDPDPTTDRGIVEYLPTAQYRWVDIVSKTPLTTLDFTFYWTNFLGQTFPLYLDPYASMNIKVIFAYRAGATPNQAEQAVVGTDPRADGRLQRMHEDQDARAAAGAGRRAAIGRRR